MLKITKRLIIGAFCLCLALGAQAQDKKEVKKEEKQVKLVVVDKHGKKHVLDEKYTGEMPESLKKKIAEFKANMKKNGVDVHFNYTEEGKNKFFFNTDEGKKGQVKIITMDDEDADKNIFVESFDGEMSEELKQKIEALKKSGKHDGKIFINIDSDAETIELHGPHEGTKVAGGHLLVKKNGKVLLDEQFEGKMPERLKKQLEEIKNEDDEGDLDIQIKLTGPSEGHRKAHKVIRKKVEAAGDESAVFEIKVDGKGAKNQQIWISKDGEEMKLDGDEKHFIFNVDVMEEGDGTKEIAKSVFVFHVLHIEDIKEEDEDIPAEFRFGDQPKLDESISELSFYPNPNDGQFKLNFNLKDKGNTEISIFDLNGKEIYREQLNDFTGSYSKDVNLQSQPKGLYILKISQGDKVMSKKLVLQ